MTSVGCPGRKSTRSGYPTNAALIIAVSYICQGIKERSGKRIRSPATQPRRTKRAVGVSRNALITNQIGAATRLRRKSHQQIANARLQTHQKTLGRTTPPCGCGTLVHLTRAVGLAWRDGRCSVLLPMVWGRRFRWAKVPDRNLSSAISPWTAACGRRDRPSGSSLGIRGCRAVYSTASIPQR